MKIKPPTRVKTARKSQTEQSVFHWESGLTERLLPQHTGSCPRISAYTIRLYTCEPASSLAFSHVSGCVWQTETDVDFRAEDNGTNASKGVICRALARLATQRQSHSLAESSCGNCANPSASYHVVPHSQSEYIYVYTQTNNIYTRPRVALDCQSKSNSISKVLLNWTLDFNTWL